jgi:uncharacterized protein (DUF488 family)
VSAREILTIGHSTHPEERFLALLARHRVETLADVRRFPSSRRLPHFNAPRLESSLGDAGIAYERLGESLGGRREADSDTLNAGWRVGGFRGYADHMASAEFLAGLARLRELGEARRTAFMCAEGPWWRCHRQLIADALTVRGWSVLHVMPDGRADPHRLTPFAVVDGERITYPPRQATLG